MLGFFKNLLRKPQNGAESHDVVPSHPNPPAATPAFNQARPNLVRQSTGRGVELPLRPILACLPLELQPFVLHPEVGSLTISIPLEKVLAQLSRGSVRISFGELRHAAPEVFADDPEHDRVLVPLPLGDILHRLNPALIQRRRTQRRVEVPSEISSPFDRFGQVATFTEEAMEEPPPQPAPAPVPRRITPVARQSSPVIQPPQPPSAFAPRVPLPASRQPAVPMAPPHAPPAKPVIPPPAPAPAPAMAAEAAPAPAPIPLKGNGGNDSNGQAKAPPAFAAAPKTPALPPLMVPLTAVAESWPEPVRKEILEQRLITTHLALPFEKVEQTLKMGRILFSWKTLRGWMKPPLPAGTSSPHDNTVLELPLKTVTPLFISRQKEHSKPQQKVEIDEDIPNLFFGFPQAENPNGPTVAQATARPADTNYYVWDDTADSVRVHEAELKRGPSPGTRFVAKYATPNEIVSRTAALDGVAGSLIALPDGLMVASQLPAEFNGETLAAFLPQIFGKVSQCTKELRMGDLNNLNFTVGNIPWKIFRVNAIFFAAFGRPGEPLPTAQLAALAAELDHNPK